MGGASKSAWADCIAGSSSPWATPLDYRYGAGAEHQPQLSILEAAGRARSPRMRKVGWDYNRTTYAALCVRTTADYASILVAWASALSVTRDRLLVLNPSLDDVDLKLSRSRREGVEVVDVSRSYNVKHIYMTNLHRTLCHRGLDRPAMERHLGLLLTASRRPPKPIRACLTLPGVAVDSAAPTLLARTAWIVRGESETRMNRMRSKFHAVIVAQRPAVRRSDSSRSHHRVVVTEKQHLPREKVCGGCVPGSAWNTCVICSESRSTLRLHPGRDVTHDRTTSTHLQVRWRLNVDHRAEADMRLAEAAEEPAEAVVVRTGEAATVRRGSLGQ